MPSKEFTDFIIESINKKFDRIEERFDKQDIVLEDLKSFKWMSLGVITAAGSIGGILATLATLYFYSKGNL